MIIKAKGTVTLPKRPHSIGNLLPFCREVVTCLQQLRDRAWDVPRGGSVSGGSSCTQFFMAISASNKFTVTISTVAGLTPSGFTAGLKEFTITTSSGVVFSKLVINSSGVPVSSTVEQAASLPTDTATDFHREIGQFAVTTSVLSISQTRCGPFNAAICRNWFASVAPFYGVTWS